ncbi:hypothetical protein FB565_008555 [Actinoplanes lutulentus]|uniref:KAP-like P-loop domain-containing protein n=1 Tax=Actinoplanes lutulentus TaxID=1287878 RepID=A0A327Z395_9ACTN|nr:P-loop NTPase fold protein [Actinoplanes lutulentus]MBB2948769.1 hypothetical protein [Actinoplanes lutulentus]RAK29681.1 KAP-like P-loop domain-containing protein [Actinoplanes lutulentus]
MPPNSATGDGLNRRALLVSVGFTAGPDPEGSEASWPRLPFAAAASAALGSALEPFGYEPRFVADLAASEVSKQIEDAITSTPKDGVLIVHFVGHSHVTVSGQLAVIGADGQKTRTTEYWVDLAADHDVRLLLLLDTSHAGRAVRSSEQLPNSNIWVIAGADDDHAAFSGRFTAAVIEALRELAADSGDPYIGYPALVPRVADVLDRLVVEAQALPQRISYTRLDLLRPNEFFFFPLRGTRPASPNARWEVQTRGYGDRPTFDDHLRREALWRSLADLIEPTATTADDQDSGPTVLVIDGPWGTGKTSLAGLARQHLEATERAAEQPDTKPGPLRVRDADRALSGKGPAVWEPAMMRHAPAATTTPPIISVRFDPWAHQTTEQVWAGLTRALLDAVEDKLLPESEESTRRYWFQRNISKLDRMALRRSLRRATISPLLAVSALALLVPIIAQMARSPDDYNLLVFTIAGSNIAVLLTTLALLGSIGHTLWRYFRRPAADFLPADLFVGPIPADATSAEKPAADAALRDPYYRARSGYLYLRQHDVFDVLTDVEKAGHYVVVYIDDLDRCSPRTTADVFEAINVFVNASFPVTRFVLCLDATVVVAHLDEAYPSLGGQRKFARPLDPTPGWSFLRKVVQLLVPVTAMAPGRVEDLLDDLLRSRPDVPDPVSAPDTRPSPAASEQPAAAGAPAPALIDQGSAGDSVVVRQLEALEHHPRVRASLAARAAAFPQLSAREVKRFLTTWQFYVRVFARVDPLAEQDDVVERAEHLVLLAELLVRWPAAQRLHSQRVDGRLGLSLLAESAGDDQAWNQTLRRLRLTGPHHDDFATGVRAILRTPEGLAMTKRAESVL